jgi:hypothetical protein
VHASHRNNTTTPGLVYRFRGFSVTQPDSTPPAAPNGLTSNATTDAVSLTWNAPADTDLAGYQVFRATASPVPTTGTPYSGTAPTTARSFVDDGVLAGPPTATPCGPWTWPATSDRPSRPPHPAPAGG